MIYFSTSSEDNNDSLIEMVIVNDSNSLGSISKFTFFCLNDSLQDFETFKSPTNIDFNEIVKLDNSSPMDSCFFFRGLVFDDLLEGLFDDDASSSTILSTNATFT